MLGWSTLDGQRSTVWTMLRWYMLDSQMVDSRRLTLGWLTLNERCSDGWMVNTQMVDTFEAQC